MGYQVIVCSSQTENNRMDNLGGTVPYVLKSCNLQHIYDYKLQ